MDGYARLDASRAVYLRGTNGNRFGRPPIGTPSKYLLTNLAQCGCCGSTMKFRTRSHGKVRARFYGCAGYHDRGRTVCRNNADIPMEDADGIVLEALLDDVLTPDVLTDAVDGALRLLQADEQAPDDSQRLEVEIARVERERSRLVSAVVAGGELTGPVDALRDREAVLTRLEGEREALRDLRKRRPRVDVVATRRELLELAGNWRQVLTEDPLQARPILSTLLVGRVSFTPLEGQRRRWKMHGTGTLTGLFNREIVPFGMASPTGFGARRRSRRKRREFRWG